MIGATHYCGSFAPRAGDSERSLEDFVTSRLHRLSSISEGSELFAEYKACALRDVERSLFFSASHYRRALDLMIPSSAHWAQVTLYYGSLFAARALLGMFGCGVFGTRIVEVNQSIPKSQILNIKRLGNRANQYYVSSKGPHRRFWEIFYNFVPPISRLVEARLTAVLSPVAGNANWLIEERNKVNYDTSESVKSAETMRSFDAARFPRSLPSALHTQYRICEGIFEVGFTFANQFGLQTDALDRLDPSASLSKRVLNLVYDPVAPDLVEHSKKEALL